MKRLLTALVTVPLALWANFSLPEPLFFAYVPFCAIEPSTSRCGRSIRCAARGGTVTWRIATSLIGWPTFAAFLVTVTMIGKSLLFVDPVT